MASVRIDLHRHSAASDGVDSPSEVVRRGRAAALDVLALTDHDTAAGHEEAAGALAVGQTLARGAELSCSVDGASVHLLAYLFDPAEPSLAAELDRLRTDRVRRARGMVDRLVALGVPIVWERVRELAAGEAIGRPHIARAMVEAGAVPDVESAFTDEWIGSQGRAHISKYAPAPAEAIRLVHDAGGVSVLAHPYASERGDSGCDDAAIAELAAAGLCGVEVDHPGHNASARQRLRGLAADLDLAVTGGSDDHGADTPQGHGAGLTAPGEYERLLSRAKGVPLVVG